MRSKSFWGEERKSSVWPFIFHRLFFSRKKKQRLEEKVLKFFFFPHDRRDIEWIRASNVLLCVLCTEGLGIVAPMNTQQLKCRFCLSLPPFFECLVRRFEWKWQIDLKLRKSTGIAIGNSEKGKLHGCKNTRIQTHKSPVTRLCWLHYPD